MIAKLAMFESLVAKHSDFVGFASKFDDQMQNEMIHIVKK